MMNKRIRSMIDAIFAEMKMTAENLALRDELMANAQARYEDAIAQGRTEEEAFAEVAASLEDVQTLLCEMNGGAAGEEAAKTEPQQEQAQAEPQAADAADEQKEAPKAQPQQVDLGDALNKAFGALGDWGQSIMPAAKKIVVQVDDATGGMLRDIGKAVNKTMRDAQRAAGDVIDRYQKEQEKTPKGEKNAADEPQAAKREKSPHQMREEAKDLRAQAELKRVVGDDQTAEAMCAEADALETQADALEQAQAMEQASKEAQAAAAETAEKAEAAGPDEPAELGDFTESEEAEPIYGADGELDEDAFAKSVEQMTRDAEEVLRQTGEKLEDLGRKAEEAAGQAGEAIRKTVLGEDDPRSSVESFPVAGLRKIDVKLDEDDVIIEGTQGSEVQVIWESRNAQGEPKITLRNHVLTIQRKNPDVFKTFFSVFSKEGGRVIVRVPGGYAADYVIATTSGDVQLCGLDADGVKISTTSGDVRVETDANVRAREIQVNTVSGDATISAQAFDIGAGTVSGDVFVSCDANRVKAEGVSGDIHIEGACDEWDVESVSGDVELICTVVPTGKIEVNTLSGDARVALPGSIRGFVASIDSLNGQLINEFGPNRYGTCSLPIHMDAVSGNLTISRL